jgi:Ice-binding-like
MISSRAKWLLPLIIAVLCLAGVFNARANLYTVFPEMVPLQQWTVFSLGGGITDTTTTDDITGTTYIQGNVGVGGSGDINLTGNVTIDGNLVYRSNGTLKMSGNSRVNGMTIHGQDSDLDASSNAAIMTSNHAFAMLPNRTQTSFTGSGDTTVSGAPFETVVFKLTNFALTGGTFTLQGSVTTNFVFNVTNQFSLSGAAKIVLSGGVTWNNVLWNVTGGGTGPSLTGQSSLQGVLMANNRTISISGGSSVAGKVIANKVSLSGGSQITSP